MLSLNDIIVAMNSSVSAPRSPGEWLIFAGGVFFTVATIVFLTTRNPTTSVKMGASSIALTVGLMTVLVFFWRSLVGVVAR